MTRVRVPDGIPYFTDLMVQTSLIPQWPRFGPAAIHTHVSRRFEFEAAGHFQYGYFWNVLIGLVTEHLFQEKDVVEDFVD
jgi:hypothetical protein